MAAGEVRTLPVPADAATVVVNLTSVAGNRGFVTAWPSGSPIRPLVSSLNSEGTGDIVANLAAVPAATGMQFYSQSGTNLVVDLAGWFLTGSGPRTVVALFADCYGCRPTCLAGPVPRPTPLARGLRPALVILARGKHRSILIQVQHVNVRRRARRRLVARRVSAPGRRGLEDVAQKPLVAGGAYAARSASVHRV